MAILFSAQSTCQKCCFVYARFGETPQFILIRWQIWGTKEFQENNYKNDNLFLIPAPIPVVQALSFETENSCPCFLLLPTTTVS